MERNLPARLCSSGVKQASHGFIQPGKPTQNAFVESLNGKFRNECLNQHWFRTLNEARYEIELWREHYNNVRPHSSLNYMSPVEYKTGSISWRISSRIGINSGKGQELANYVALYKALGGSFLNKAETGVH